MPKFRKRPVTVEAVQWFKHGDVNIDIVRHVKLAGSEEGKTCPRCGYTLEDHGFVDTLEGGHVVCPGDYIITGVNGEHYPCKPDIFAKTYEEVNE
ncbi:MAG: PGDYG domain-containing protein [Pyramidobacter sp.]|uniref:hypothetical protein n=1 Tax=Pyramidobacter sp. TaxID=1943581 RepID=UPI0025F15EE5|nr:hypothetical protein [Pyramidobacter sp.]MCI7403964.1 PGDYG domain-containing protein [Pyramidobacter sp.]